ncbi:hypothetical protein SAMN05421740_102590 [Parapedobacter koreensis]|uniref:Urease accessory protein UreH-like transmembrane domain-containing protein n=1 Tax=Parapedobacter koreensis TaxID=332977 RepID=A0A1H7JKE7_9SPHI|nr:hypothetical protein SAMN05421740_102590 [Parapedobacter koreensis]
MVFAFFMGVFGSLHCVAMCGPLVLALPSGHQSRWMTLVNAVVYQVGRVAVYGMLGLLAGFIGNAVETKGWQQGISVVTGLLLMSVGLLSIWRRRFRGVVRAQQIWVKPVAKWIGYWLYRPGGYFMVGALNGLLPCGMVYMALVAALSADSAYGGGLFMLLFGLGTWPAMLLVSAMGNVAKRYIRFNLAFWLPVICLLMGGWFLLRGASLDIPYLSPAIYPTGAVNCK